MHPVPHLNNCTQNALLLCTRQHLAGVMKVHRHVKSASAVYRHAKHLHDLVQNGRVQVARNEASADALDFVRPRCASRNHRALAWLDRNDLRRPALLLSCQHVLATRLLPPESFLNEKPS